jgi:Fic family protein
MSTNTKKLAVLSQLKKAQLPLGLPEISVLMADTIPERTLRRWLALWVESGVLQRTGQKRGTHYQLINSTLIDGIADPAGKYKSPLTYTFLNDIPKHRRPAVLEQIRDLWTHNSTALEGNTLTLGDTHAVLGLGLTVSGKPLREHQEILGHAKAIELLYQCISTPLTKEVIYKLHKAVQTEIVHDIYKPIGAWKVEVNGTYAVSSEGKQVFIEYAHPMHVDGLMEAVIKLINAVDVSIVSFKTAAHYFAKVHMAIVHIHPFCDGNGRIARLLSNIILLKAGLPPLVIEKSQRREYIECLADYQVEVGQLTNATGLWPNEEALESFINFCEYSYNATKELIDEAKKNIHFKQ